MWKKLKEFYNKYIFQKLYIKELEREIILLNSYENNCENCKELIKYRNLQDLCENYYVDFENMQFQQDLEEFLKNYNEKPKITKRKEEGT
jgi:hypothetical protein